MMLSRREVVISIFVAIIATITGCWTFGIFNSSFAPACTIDANLLEAVLPPRFLEIASLESDGQKMDVKSYLQSIEQKATEFILSGEMENSKEFAETLKRTIRSIGGIHLVLGGKNVGKTFVKDKVINETRSSIVSNVSKDDKLLILDVNMRARPGTQLFEMLTRRAVELLDQKQFLPTGYSEFLARFIGLVGATAAEAVSGTIASGISALAASLGEQISERERISPLNRLLTDVHDSGGHTVIVVDEANLALPGFSSTTEIQQTMAFLVRVTKEFPKQASLLLLTSEYAYPYKLQEKANMNLQDLDTIILAPELSKEHMLALLTGKWGMGFELAAEFYRFYGGHIRLSYKALQRFSRKATNFHPLSALADIKYQSAVQNLSARDHLCSIANRGFSVIQDLGTDAAARLLVEAGIAGVITEDTITFGMPHIPFQDSSEFALVPTQSLMRNKIIKSLVDIEHSRKNVVVAGI